MIELTLDSKTPVKLRIFRQWLAVVIVRIPLPKSPGIPAADQRLPIVFIVEQQQKPDDEYITKLAADKLGMASVFVSSIEVYPTDRVQYVPVKDELDEPLPEAPADR